MTKNSDQPSLNRTSGPDVALDITRDICPMTFVRTRLLLDRLAPGSVVRIRLAGREPLGNVPRSARELGHTVLALEPEAEGARAETDPWILTLRKKA